MSSLWEKCLQRLESEFPPQQINTWVRPLQAEVNNNDLHLYAPNKFVLDWASDHFIDRISTIINELSNGDTRVLLKIGSSNNTSFTPKKQPVLLIKQK